VDDPETQAWLERGSPEPTWSKAIPRTKAEDAYVLVFTCTDCEARFAKKISKKAYHNGLVLARCPGCEAYHLIADHLGWFDDNSITIEDIMAQRGDLVNSTSSSTPVQIEGLSEAEQTAFRDRLLAAIARSEQTKK
jgi:hypothetical protein